MSKLVIPRIDVGQAFADAKKFQVAVAGGLGQVLALNLLHGQVEHWTQLALGAVTALGVYVTPNSARAVAEALAAVEGLLHPSGTTTPDTAVSGTSGKHAADA